MDEIIYSELIYERLTGIKFKKIKHVKSSGNFEIYPDDVILPSYREMIVNGKPFNDDFGIYHLPNNYPFLVTSEKALKILLNRNCQNIMGEKIPFDIDLHIYFENVLAILSKVSLGSKFPYFHVSMFFTKTKYN